MKTSKLMHVYKKYPQISLIISTLIFMVFIVWVLPQEAQKAVELNLVGSIDTSLFYTPRELLGIAEAYGPSGRAFYIHQRFTFDLIWPLVYGYFIYSWTNFLLKSPSRLSLLVWVPVILDYLENISAAYVLWRFPHEAWVAATLASLFTPLKWISLSLSFMVLLGLGLLKIFHQIRKRMR